MEDGGKSRDELLREVADLRRQLAAVQQDHQNELDALRDQYRDAETKWLRRLKTLEAELAASSPESRPPHPHPPEHIDLPEDDPEFQRLLATVESQSEELQTTNEELTLQTEELRVQNEELTSQQKILEEQKAELQRLAREVDTERALLAAVLEQMPSSVVIVKAPAGPILLNNHRAEELFRQAPGSLADLKGFWALPFCSPEGRVYDKPEHPLWRSLTMGEVIIDQECTFQPPGAAPIHLSVSSAPVRGSQGEIVAGVVTHFDLTVRKRAEETLRASEARYRSLVQLSPDAILVHRRGKIVFLNAAAVKLLLASSPGDLLGQPALDLVHPDHRDLVAERMKKAEAGRTTELQEVQLLRLDGQVVEVEAAGSGVMFQGKPSVQVVFRDITEQKRAREALRVAHQNLQTLIQASPLAIMRLDREARILSCNPAGEQIFGWSAAELRGRRLPMVPPDELVEVMKILRRVEAGERFTGVERRRLRKDGSLIDLSVSVAPMYDDTGDYTGTVNIFEDITERKQTQEALRQREVQLQTILENITEGVVVADLDSRLFHLNPAALALYGFTCLEECQRPLSELTDIFELSTVKDGILPLEQWPLARILRGETLRDREVCVRRKDAGWQRIFSYGGALARDPEGRPLLAVLSLRDVTARHAAEAALRKSREDLNRAQAVAHIGSWWLDLQRNELLWSDETYRISGIPPGTSLTYEGFLSIVHPEDREYVHQKWTAALKGAPYDIEHRIVVGGIVKWVREKAELEFDPQGRVLGSFGTVQDITDRKHAENELLQAKEEWELTFNSVPDLIAIIDRDHHILRVNRAMAALLGTDPHGLVGRPCYQIMHRNSEPPPFCPHSRLLADGQEHTTEFQELGRNFLVSATPLTDSQGNLLGSVHVARDITALKQVEQALQHSNQRLDLLAETASQLLTSGSPQEVVDSLCHKVMAFLNCDAFFNFLVDENEGRLYLNACAGIPPQETKRIEWLDYGVAVCGCAAQEGCRIVTENIQTTPDPRTELVKSYGIRAYACHPLLRQGRVLGTLSFGTRARDHFSQDDLALMKAVADQVAVALDRKLAEAALQKSEARERAWAAELQAVLDAMPGVILLAHDPECRVITGSLAAYELMRIPPGENLSKTADDPASLYHFRVMKDGREIPPQELPVQRAATGITVRNFEFDMVFDDGTARHFLGNAVPLLVSAGQPQGAVAAFIDITERKQAQKALQQTHDQLEQRVRERTIELQDTVAQLIEEVQERQQAQEALRKQAELLELAHEAITVRDLDSRVIFWNRGAEEKYGWTRQQALGQITHDLFQTRFPVSRQEVDRQLLETGFWQGELVHTRSDGEEIIVSSRQALQRDDQGRPVAILEINRDVTARRQAEAALKMERQRLLALLERIPAHVALLRPDYTFAYTNPEFIRRLGEPGAKRCYELLGQPAPCEECHALTVFGSKTPAVWEWTGPDGNIYQIHDYPFIDVDGSPLVLEMGVDITARKQAENQALSLGRMYRMLSKANEAIVRLAGEGDKDVLFRQICRIMMEEGDFLLAWIGLKDPQTRLIKAAAQYDLNDDYLQNISIPYDDVPEGCGPTGTAVRTGRFDVCNDLAADPRMAPWRELALARSFRSTAAFPLRVGSQVVGVLSVYAGRPGFFTADEIDLLESLADDLSFALDFMDREALRRQTEAALRESEARLRQLASQLLHAQESERRRLALELHDDLGQSLMVLKLQVSSIEKTVPMDQWATKEECAHCLAYLNGVIENVRRLARNLRPTLLEDLGLAAGLRALIEEFRKYYEVEVALEMDDIDGVFSQQGEINIYRIFQEIINNIGKHAQAKRISIAVTRCDDSLCFRVADDGVGFDLERVRARDAAQKGLGLSALEERVYMLSGKLKIQTQKRQGTEVTFTLPLMPNQTPGQARD